MSRGRKLIGKTRRVPITYTIEKDVADSFQNYCRNSGMSASRFLQTKIEEFLAEKKNAHR